MPKLAHLKQGTQALQAKLAQKNPPNTDFEKRVTTSADRLGDRLEGAISRLMRKTSDDANKGLRSELANVVRLVRESHTHTNQSLIELAQLNNSAQAELKSVLADLKSSRPEIQSDAHLVQQLSRLAEDLSTVPRAFPRAHEVNLEPLTDLTLQVLAKVNSPMDLPVSAPKQHVFEIERDPFTDLITKVNVKEA